jgi:NADH-quinone oxidoreductase subunit C
VSETTDDTVAEDEPTSAEEPAPERYGVLLEDSLGQEVLHPSREQYAEVVAALREDGYAVCIDVTAVDYLAHPHRALPPGIAAERFEVVAQFLDHQQRRRIRLRVQVPDRDPTLASIVDQYPGADALEREVFDMFGIGFDGHPDLTRILMPEDWEGHPLRKDYAVGAIPVQFKGAGKEERR